MKTCSNCGEWFTPKFTNAKLCYACFLKRDRALREIDGVEAERDWLRERVAVERNRAETFEALLYGERIKSAKPDPIPTDKLRLLIQLAHPDKHNGSQAANDVTAWLLAQRQERAA